METLPDGGYRISDTIDIGGEGASYFVFGRGWLVEIIELTGGDYFFYSDSREVRPATRSFGVYYPRFTLVQGYSRDIKGSVRGIGSVRMVDGLPDTPFIFEADSVGEFTSIDDAVTVLNSTLSRRSIEINTRPTLLSVRSKRLIDENYLVYPSIARIAKRLGVSHAHLSRQFKRDYGLSPSAYLHHLRISEATFRLSIGEEIIDISMDVGYNDLSRFYKQFKKQTATSPAQCRIMFDR